MIQFEPLMRMDTDFVHARHYSCMLQICYKCYCDPEIRMLFLSQVMEKLAVKCGEGRGRALIRRIIAVIRTAKLLGLPFSESFEKQPIELLQLLSLKAQDSFDEAKFLVETHIMPASSIARILADSFLKVCSLLRF